MPSPFLTPGKISKEDQLAVLFLRRDQLIPTVLKAHDDENLGYDEGKVVNTRFGSFPHSTLIGKEWGSQILASKVDTGSRGRRPLQKAKAKEKRKAEELDSPEATQESSSQRQSQQPQKAAVAAASGFTHILPPTPESWTTSLPHRTQVVYAPDYSYILHRLRARPGSSVIEAGAGSGSFTHAAARAVFNGYPSPDQQPAKKRQRKRGKVYSFEFHHKRVEKVRDEIRDHGLEDLVEATHRDVYNDGFFVPSSDSTGQSSPKANAVFLDLPAPWLALKHLVREPGPDSPQLSSPLDPLSTIHICTFSPCLEQAQRTISTLRQYGWISISMVEVAHRKIEVRREKYGIEDPKKPTATVGPNSVEEAVAKLRAIDEKGRAYHDGLMQRENNSSTPQEAEPTPQTTSTTTTTTPAPAPASSSPKQTHPQIPHFAQGTLIHRTEPDLKTHTSYLVFAILPRAWSDEEEQKCREKWPSIASKSAKAGAAADSAMANRGSAPKSRRQLKREAYEERKRAREEEGDVAEENENAQGSVGSVEVPSKAEVNDVEMVDS